MKKENIILGQVETYKASSKVWSFKRVDDIVNGINLKLSNMVGGFPFEYAGKYGKTVNVCICVENFLIIQKNTGMYRI